MQLGHIEWSLPLCKRNFDPETKAVIEGYALPQVRRTRSDRKPQVIRLGHVKIETLGLSPGFWTDLYHRAMSVYWPVFFTSAAAIFIALNAVFGFLYSLGHEPIANAAANGPLAYFYFSIETLATVGYGDMHPQTNYGHLIATVEIFTRSR